MILEDLEQHIAQKVSERKGKTIALSSIRALFGVFTDPIKTLGELFFGAKEAIDSEKHSIEQNIILDLLCKIDEDIQETLKLASKKLGSSSKIFTGEVIAYGRDSESVTGVTVSSNSGPVEFKPGTRISASGDNVRNVTGLKIGD